MENQGKPKKQDNKKLMKYLISWTFSNSKSSISFLLKPHFLGNMMHDNFYEYFVGAEKHEFQKFQVIDKLKSYAS